MSGDPDRQKLSRAFQEFSFRADKDTSGASEENQDADSGFEPYAGFPEGELSSSPDPEEQEELFALAIEHLPYRSLIYNTLEWSSSLEYTSLKTAFIIEEQFRGTLDNKSVDRMTAVALLIGARNQSEIAHYYTRDVAEASDRLMDMLQEQDFNKRLRMIRGLPKLARTVMFANIAADIEVTIEDLQSHPGDKLDAEDILGLGSFIAAAATGSSGMQRGLMRRVAEGFNELSDMSGQPVRLALHQDGTLTLHRKIKPSQGRKNRPPAP